MSEENKIQEEINDILFTFLQKFKPVATLKESNLTLTTDEFIEKIRSHYPPAEFMTPENLYNFLKEKGFTYAVVGNGSRMEWLINQV